MRFPSIPFLAAAAALAIVAPASAQMVQAIPGTTDADKLAAQMRILAGDARNLDALVTAGELSLQLGDLSGATSLFARADQVDPRSGRVKAGLAALLLHEERPGEALRYYDQAVGYGYDVRKIAAERGLAYDLIGQQQRAQRDYRLALTQGPDDETTRRLALSLGISGQKDAALALLDPLTRKSDRGAWRARAFVLAMAGDVAGASSIATTMMPPGMATGLKPFFARLPTLPAVDRAFAVHFGEVRATPDRIADARLAPALGPLPPEPVALASTNTTAPAVTARERRRGRAARTAHVATASTTPAAAAAVPTRVAAATPVSVPAAPTPTAAPVRVATAYPPTTTSSTRTPTQLAPASPVAPTPTSVTSVASTIVATPDRVATPPVRIAVAAPVAAPPAQVAGSTAAVPTGVTAPPVRVASTAPVIPAGAPPVSVAASPTQVAGTLAPAPGAAPAPATAPPVQVASNATPAPTAAPAVTPAAMARPGFGETVSAADASPAPAVASPPPVTVASAPAVEPVPTERTVAAQSPTPVRRSEDAILARIIAGIAVPAAELGVPPMRPAPPAAAPVELASVEPARAPELPARREPPAERHVAVATPQQPDDTPRDAKTGAAPRRERGRPTADDTAANARGNSGKATADKGDDPATSARGGTSARGKSAKSSPDKDDDSAAAARKSAKPTAAERKAAAAKAAADKQAADDKKAAKAEPSRIWVQVAGGANEGDLDKAWAAAKGTASALAGRKGWTTPLRATNRVLAGPFKTDAEARAMVNQLAKQGISAFPFTSDPGQKVTRLGAK